MSVSLKKEEFKPFRDYIEEQCGISLGEEKSYLIENRLTTLMLENGCEDFGSFYRLIVTKNDPKLTEKIIDAMTTNETLWFRDDSPFKVLEEVILPDMIKQLASGQKYKIRIWSAACSTGQEPYSIAMLIDQAIRRNAFKGIQPAQFQIYATDISPSALFIAKSGRYNRISMNRGLREGYENRYFTKQGPVWVISDELRKMVTFEQFNLQKEFARLGRFDVILCRNVAIYFSDSFKRNLFDKLSQSLIPPGYLFLGSAETMRGYNETFQTHIHDSAVYYRLQ